MPLQTWTHSLVRSISHRRSCCSLHCRSGSWAHVSHRDESSRTSSPSMASNRLYWVDFWLWSCRKWFATGVISSKHGISSLVGGLWSMNSPDTYSPFIYSLVAMTACMMVIWFLVLGRQRPGYILVICTISRDGSRLLRVWIAGTYSSHPMAWPSSCLALPLPNYRITRLPSLIMSTLTIRCSLISVLTE